jgi:hypothetical protein
VANAKYLTVPHLNRKQLARFFSKVTVDNITGCWNWTGAINRGGYGVGTHRAKWTLTHRLMYAWAVGPLPLGREQNIDHFACQNRRCCNPSHLELVSIAINVLRGAGISARNARKTTCPLGHPLVPRKDGAGRFCRRCSIDASLASYYGGRRTVKPRQHKGSDTAA